MKTNDSKETYKHLRDAAGWNRTANPTRVLDDEGNLRVGDEATLLMGEHFNDHFKKASPLDHEAKHLTTDKQKSFLDKFKRVRDNLKSQIESGDITLQEVRKVIRLLKNCKAEGLDGLNTEIIKGCGEPLIKLIWRLCQVAYKEKMAPSTWMQTIIIPIYKKGDGLIIDQLQFQVCYIKSMHRSSPTG